LTQNRIDAGPLLENGPLFERSQLFELGCTFDCAGTDLARVAIRRALGRRNAGWWECELPGNRLTWTTGIYDIFGLPRATRVSRAEALSLYCEDSRAIMERLRGYAIDHATGFILDAKVRPANGERERWMRLIGAPLCEGGRTVGLYGLKVTV
jgi:PAS domain-containing protein